MIVPGTGLLMIDNEQYRRVFPMETANQIQTDVGAPPANPASADEMPLRPTREFDTDSQTGP